MAMAVDLTDQEKEEIFKVACSKNCLIHLRNYFKTSNGLVDLQRYRSLNWHAIQEDGVVGIRPKQKVNEVVDLMEKHINDVYPHSETDPKSISSRTKFAFNILTPEALRYAVCKVLNVSYRTANSIVIYGYRERLDESQSLYKHQDHSSSSKECGSPIPKRTRSSLMPSTYNTADRRSRSKSPGMQSTPSRSPTPETATNTAKQSSYDTRDRRSRSKSRGRRNRASRSPIPKTRPSSRQSSYDTADRRSRSKSRGRRNKPSRSPTPETATNTAKLSSYDTRDRSRSKSRGRGSKPSRSPIPKTARSTTKQSSYDTRDRRSRSKSRGRRNRESLDQRSGTYSKYSTSQERDRCSSSSNGRRHEKRQARHHSRITIQSSSSNERERSRSTSNGRWPYQTDSSRRSSSSNERSISRRKIELQSRDKRHRRSSSYQSSRTLLDKMQKKLTTSKTEVKSCFKPYSDAGKSKSKKRKGCTREFVCLRKEVSKEIELPDEREIVLLHEMGLGSLDIRIDESASSKEVEEVLIRSFPPLRYSEGIIFCARHGKSRRLETRFLMVPRMSQLKQTKGTIYIVPYKRLYGDGRKEQTFECYKCRKIVLLSCKYDHFLSHDTEKVAQESEGDVKVSPPLSSSVNRPQIQNSLPKSQCKPLQTSKTTQSRMFPEKSVVESTSSTQKFAQESEGDVKVSPPLSSSDNRPQIVNSRPKSQCKIMQISKTTQPRKSIDNSLVNLEVEFLEG